MKKENKIVLSISLLCSGRNKDDMVKCLESLMTIRKRLLSEIIVVDTGCDEENHAILEKYADQVVNFTWCDDFAKARNAGLEKCTGEWFMFIDDDEWFENTDAIVDFFKSGDYKNYGFAEYKIRNYLDQDGKRWSDTWIGRLVKLIPDLCFKGKIHEYFDPLYGPVKYLESYVHHYGYAFRSPAEKYAKIRRNVIPLREMIKKEPDNLHWRSQLVHEYEVIRDYTSLAFICSDTIKLISENNTIIANRYRADYYAGKLTADNATFQYDQTIKDFNEYIKDPRNDSLCLMSLYYMVCIAYYETKKYDEAFKCAVEYEKFYIEWTSNGDRSIEFEERRSPTLTNILSDDVRQANLSRLIPSGIHIGMSDLQQYISNVDWKSTDKKVIGPICEAITWLFCKENFKGDFVKYANTMLQSDTSRGAAVYFAKEIEKGQGIFGNDKSTDDDFKRIINIYGRTEELDYWYIQYLHFRHYDLIGDDEKINNEYNTLLTSVIDIFSLDKSVWKIAEKWSIDQPSIFKKINYDSWKIATDSFLNEHSQDRSDVVSIVDKIIRGDNDVRFRYFRLKEKEMDLINTVNTIKNGNKDDKNALIKDDINSNKEMTIKLNMAENKKILDALPEYCHSCVSFYQDIYTPEWFTGDMTVLPPQCRFAVRFLEAIDNDIKINSSSRIKELEECVDIYAPFNQALGGYIKEYGEREKAKLLQIQKNPELEKIYQMLDLLRQAMELQEKTGSDELQEGIMQQRHFVENIIKDAVKTKYSGSKWDDMSNEEWLDKINLLILL